MIDKVKITVVGAGYVGMSLGVLFAQQNDVVVHDIDKQRVQKINNNESTISDKCCNTEEEMLHYFWVYL